MTLGFIHGDGFRTEEFVEDGFTTTEVYLDSIYLGSYAVDTQKIYSARHPSIDGLKATTVESAVQVFRRHMEESHRCN